MLRVQRDYVMTQKRLYLKHLYLLVQKKKVFDRQFPANGHSSEVFQRVAQNQELDGVSLNISYTLLGKCCVFGSIYLIASYIYLQRLKYISKLKMKSIVFQHVGFYYMYAFHLL